MAKAKSTTFQQVLSSLKKKDFAPVYFLHGEEAFYIDEISKFIEQNALDEGARAFNQTVLYGKDIDYKTVLDNARRYPVMSEKQVVIIKEAQELKTLDKLEGYFDAPLESTILVIAHKHKKLDKRKKFAKNLGKNPQICLFESKKLYDNQVPAWISNYIKEQGLSIKPNATSLLAEYLGSDLAKIANELDKLTINLPKGSTIDNAIIQKNIGISKDYNVFELQNALGKRDSFKSFMIVKYFIANPKNHPLPMITATLYNFFSKVYVCQSLMRSSNDGELAQRMGVNKFFLADYKGAAKRYSRLQLETIFDLLQIYDLRSKGVENVSTDHGELLKELIAKMLQ